MLSRHDGFVSYGKMGIEFFSTSELFYPNKRQIKSRSNFKMISCNPNVSLGFVNCSLYNHRFALKDGRETNRHACLYSRGVQLSGNSCKDVHHSWQTKPVHSGKHFQQGSSSSE